MMKLLLLLSLSILLFAEKNKDTCYTVQILSEKDTPKTRTTLLNQNYADGCKVMKIGRNQTVRCGCYNSSREAKKKLRSLYDEYTEAYITKTYKYRFKNMKKHQKKLPVKVKSEIDEKTQCYSVEIFNRYKTDENMEYISTHNFPKSCKEMDFGDKISLRCGCYKSKDDVLNEYLRLKEQYKNTIIKISEIKAFKENRVDNDLYLKKIAKLEAFIGELKETIRQQELYIENMDDVEEVQENDSGVTIDNKTKKIIASKKVKKLKPTIKKDVPLKDEDVGEEIILEDMKFDDEDEVVNTEAEPESDLEVIEDSKVIEKKKHLFNSYFLSIESGVAMDSSFENSGSDIGAEIGYYFNKNIFMTLNYQLTNLLDANFHYMATSLNYKFDKIWSMSPYVGVLAGLGSQYSAGDSVLIGSQIGLEINLVSTLDIYTDYKYMKVDFSSSTVVHDGEHDINIGLRYHF